MSCEYGFGLSQFLDDDEQTIAALKKIARSTAAVLRDVIADDVVEVDAEGHMRVLDGPDAAEIRDAVDRGGGSMAYSAFEDLDGLPNVFVAGLSEEMEYDDIDIDGDLVAGPITDLLERLSDLAEADVTPQAAMLHQDLLQMADVAQRLRVPLVLGS